MYGRLIKSNLSDNEPIDIALWQNGRRLAHYSDRLGRILSQHEGAASIDLIMIPSKCFSGRLAPKIKLQTFCHFDSGVGSHHQYHETFDHQNRRRTLSNTVRKNDMQKRINSAVCHHHHNLRRISRSKLTHNDQIYCDDDPIFSRQQNYVFSTSNEQIGGPQ